MDLAEMFAILEKHAAHLMEHFDAVQIVATRSSEDEGSAFLECGMGNHFTRRGLVEEWLLREKEKSRIQVNQEAADGDEAADQGE